MKVKTNPIKPLCLFTLLSFKGVALADVYTDIIGSIFTDPVVSAGEIVTVKQTDTAIIGDIKIGPAKGSNHIKGNLVNYGQTYTWKDVFVDQGGVLENYGNLSVAQALSITGNQACGKIINHTGGKLILSGYMDFYCYSAELENAGILTVVSSVGYWNYQLGLTSVMRGRMRNTGALLIDNSESSNNCNNLNWPFAITNEGVFEIASGSVCDFATSPAQPISQTGTKYPRTGTSYTQVSGETVVNGTFGVHTLSLKAGKLSGNGTVKRAPKVLGLPALEISPGSQIEPIGKLTLIPEQGITIFNGTVNIDLSSKGNDLLQVEGNFYMSGSAHLYVTVNRNLPLRRGLSFTIITGAYVDTNFSSEENALLPPLPAGLKWQIVNDGTSVKLNII